jgi:hypothetical protein
MSMVFRTFGAASRSLSQALVPAALLILGLVIYTGFTIPTRDMLGWSRWMNYINPIAYGFEALMVNEFHDRSFTCMSYVPSGDGYENVNPENRICNAVSATPGATDIDGDAWLAASYEYYHSNLWRNFGIIIAFMVFFMFVYLFATEFIAEAVSKGEVLVFRRGHQPKIINDDETSGSTPAHDDTNPENTATEIQRQTAIFQWKDLCYDITIKGEPRRILDNVCGWVKPGTATALMVSLPSHLRKQMANDWKRVSLELERLLYWMFLLPE